ncbi:MAG: tripartite tricarboxylate transporter permease [bacterium]
MLQAALAALAVFADPQRLGLLMVGVLAGFVVGMLPGLGGIVAVSVLLPIIFRFDASTGLAMLTGALAVVYTSDTITAVLVGTPGSPASAPTAIEGHPLARQGQAARALSAAFLSSLVGGFLGILGLTLSIPIARPLVMLLGSPELFMFTALGVTYAGSLLGASRVKGMLAGLLGVLLGLIGPAPAAAEFRYIFGKLYLMDGLSLVLVALGVFGIAECVSLLARGGAIAADVGVGRGWLQGVRDVIEHRWLLLRGTLIGIWAGVLPAIGATAAAWMSYGHAVATAADRRRFGKGDIRGIIAPESANNAAAAGDLIPTLLFSVPGGPAAAIILGALYAYGIFPGPRLVQEHLDIVYVIVWSYALANIIGALLCFAISPVLARVTFIRFALIAPPLLIAMVLGAYQTTRHMGDFVALVLLGLLGWAMKRSGWPRAPLLIGFVLARPMERYFWLTVKLHDWRWLAYPSVLAIGALLVAPLVWDIVRWLRKTRRPATTATAASAIQERSWLGVAMSAVALMCFATALWLGWRFEYDARLLPLAAAIPGVALGGLQLLRALRGERPPAGDAGIELDDDEGESTGAVSVELKQFLLIAGYALLIWLAGFLMASLVFLLVFLTRVARMRPTGAVVYTALALGAFHLLGAALDLRWPPGVIFR